MTPSPTSETMEPPAPAGPAAPPRTVRVVFALAGLHRVVRGAEVAFESIAGEVALRDRWDVTLIGSGALRDGAPYAFRHAGCVRRERFEKWPSLPALRTEMSYEELTFAPGLFRAFRPRDFDLTVTCAYPYTNWVLRRGGKRRLPHVFVTQNGDWPAFDDKSEFRWFSCDGLVCTNPEYYARNKDRWRSVLIPNGVDPERFTPGRGDRDRFGLPSEAPVALMVSALIPSKRTLEGVRAAAKVPDLHLVLAGDGPQRAELEALGRELMGDRFRRGDFARSDMPELYRCADVFLHMSQDEPSANAYIEALATGLPVVTHDRDVTRWTFEDTALLVDTNDLDLVARTIGEALGRKTDADIARRRDLVDRRFAWSRIADQYIAFFDEVLKASGRGGAET